MHSRWHQGLCGLAMHARAYAVMRAVHQHECAVNLSDHGVYVASAFATLCTFRVQAAASAVHISNPSSLRSSIGSGSDHGADADFGALLRWASEAVHVPCAHVQQLPGRGRGLVANVDVPPDGVILSVPFSRVFASKEPLNEQQSQQQPAVELAGVSHEQQQWQQEKQQEQVLVQDEHAHMPWVAEMAARLLLERQRCRQGSPDAKSCTWLACLPTHVATPLEFSEAELAACGDPALVADVEQLKTSLQAAHELLQPQLSAADCGSWEDFMWAVQVGRGAVVCSRWQMMQRKAVVACRAGALESTMNHEGYVFC